MPLTRTSFYLVQTPKKEMHFTLPLTIRFVMVIRNVEHKDLHFSAPEYRKFYTSLSNYVEPITITLPRPLYFP